MRKAAQRKLLMANGATVQQLEDPALQMLSPTPSQAVRHHRRLRLTQRHVWVRKYVPAKSRRLLTSALPTIAKKDLGKDSNEGMAG
jgi:hypothetical protein